MQRHAQPDGRRTRRRPGGGCHLVLVSGGAGGSGGAPDAPGGQPAPAEVAAALARATDEVVATSPLVLPLALSLCMERHDAGVEGLIAVMQALRKAVLAESGLDAASEPVPLVAGDPRTAALRLAEHLRALLVRAAQACAAAPDEVASAAAARLA